MIHDRFKNPVIDQLGRDLAGGVGGISLILGDREVEHPDGQGTVTLLQMIELLFHSIKFGKTIFHVSLAGVQSGVDHLHLGQEAVHLRVHEVEISHDGLKLIYR